jgi:hypothetical protein
MRVLQGRTVIRATHQRRRRAWRSRVAAALLLGFSTGTPAAALNPVSWTCQQTIRRSDTSTSWTSPTAIDLGLAAYRWDYEVTRASATAIITVDILSELGDLRMGSGVTRDLPAVLVEEPLAEPTTGTTADLRIEVDTAGFGRATASNIQLGTVSVFGVPVAISRVDLEATIRVEGFFLGDFNLDRSIDAGDYATWVGAYGVSGDLLADANRDGAVDAADYTGWRDRVPQAPVAAPEPSGALLAACAVLAMARWRSRLP